MNRLKKLRSGEICWATSLREYVKEMEKQVVCIYCGSARAGSRMAKEKNLEINSPRNRKELKERDGERRLNKFRIAADRPRPKLKA